MKNHAKSGRDQTSRKVAHVTGRDFAGKNETGLIGKPQQLHFSFPPALPARKRGRRPLRYLQFLSLVREAVGANGEAPSYGQICAQMGLAERANVRQLVVYGERRGEVQRMVGGRRIGLVAA